MMTQRFPCHRQAHAVEVEIGFHRDQHGFTVFLEDRSEHVHQQIDLGMEGLVAGAVGASHAQRGEQPHQQQLTLLAPPRIARAPASPAAGVVSGQLRLAGRRSCR